MREHGLKLIVKESITSALAYGAVFAIYGGAVTTYRLAGAFRQHMRLGGIKRPSGSLRLLMTGTFHNEGWLRSHLEPIVKTSSIEKIYLVADKPWYTIDKVQYVSPPEWLTKLSGRSAARLIMVLCTTITKRPDWLMGYHIMPNAVACLVASSLVGGRSVYQMTGGQIQLIGGGAHCENAILRRLRGSSWTLERITFYMARYFDLVVVRGKKAQDFVRRNQVGAQSVIITGSIDTEHFKPDGGHSEFDLVCVSRLSSYKGISYLLKVIAEIRNIMPSVRLSLVGDGDFRHTLERQVADLKIGDNVVFQGKMSDVVDVLCRAKLFILTSPSEGMSIAMLEAMSTGLPVAVTNVGDLGDAVKEGKNGIFLPGDNPSLAAKRVVTLLQDEQTLRSMSKIARQLIVDNYSIVAIANRWDKFFCNYAARKEKS